MKIYVAAQYTDKDRVRRVYEALRREGHEVTYDWTNDVEPDLAAQLDADGVRKCDALLLLPYKCGKGGAWFEAGLAYGLGKKIVAVCRSYHLDPINKAVVLDLDDFCVFLRLPGVVLVTDIFAAYAELRS
jgi:hypothetical protein